MLDGLVEGAKSAMSVAAACAAMGIMAHAVVMTGLALKIVFLIKTLAGGQQLLALVLTMLISIFFGMGIPTTASYIIIAVLGAPVLVEMGVPLLSVHLFIYYYAILANLTPPVASAALVAARVGGAEYIKTAITAVRIGLPGFILPFIFIYHPELLLEGNITAIISVIASSLCGVFCMASFFEGYLLRIASIIERVMLGFASILLIYPDQATDLIGYVLLALVIFNQWRIRKTELIRA